MELTSQDKKAAVPVEDNDGFNRSHIIGKSKALMDVLATIKRIARTNASVLITGESGTGKELIAEAVHLNSSRSKKPFVKVNLGGISHTLFESEMFGHKKERLRMLLPTVWGVLNWRTRELFSWMR